MLINVIAGIFIVFTAPWALQGFTQAQRDNELAQVYSICNESRMSPVINETECGNAQDLTNTEFLCEQANTLPTNHCWVEEKQ